MLTVAYITW